MKCPVMWCLLSSFICASLCRFQSGNTSFSGGPSHHPGSSMGWWPYREHVRHDGDDDGAAGTANGRQQLDKTMRGQE